MGSLERSDQKTRPTEFHLSPYSGLRRYAFRRSVDPRVPVDVGCVAAFGTYLITAVGLSIWPVHPAAGIVALSILAAFLAWWTTLPGAIGIGVLGWLFYSGFVTHTHGQLGVTGIADAIAAALLIACALVSAVVHLLLLRLAPRVRRRHPVITHRRTGDQPVTILIAEPGKARKLV